MNTQQLRAKAVSRKKSLLLTIRMNRVYKGYSSRSNGHTATDRLRIIAEAEAELKALVIPAIVIKTIGYSFSLANGDYLGSVYNPDFTEALEEALQYTDETTLKHEAITKVA